MRQKARPHPDTEELVFCPFCETAGERTSPVRWCTGCGAERSVDSAGDVVFDADRKADRQTLAAANRRGAGRQPDGLRGAAMRRPLRLEKKKRQDDRGPADRGRGGDR